MFLYQRILSTAICSVAIFITACGGEVATDSPFNDQTDTDSESSNQITVSRIQGPREAEENRTVSFFVTAEGNGADNLTYDWEVSHSGSNINFSGQNTNRITFNTPDISGSSTIQVRLNYELSNGTLLGNNSDLHSLIIFEQQPASHIAETGKTTELPEVTTLDLSNMTGTSTWSKNEYIEEIETVGNTTTTFDIATNSIVYITPDGGRLTERDCVNSTETTLLSNIENTSAFCANGSGDIRYYQADDAFRAEVTCSNNIAYTANYKRISNEVRTNLGRISLNFQTYNDLETTDQTCGAFSTMQGLTTSPDSPIQLLTYASTYLIKTEYENEPLTISLVTDRALGSNFVFLGSFFDPELSNAITFQSLMLNGIDRQTGNDNGVINFFFSTFNRVNGDFEVGIRDASNNVETVEAEFVLFFD